MEVELPEDQQNLYGRLYISTLDLGTAFFALSVIMKKGWHYQPWERRGSIYSQQVTYTTSLVVSYARPFVGSKGWPKLPAEIKQFSLDEEVLHNEMMMLRHAVFAHSQSDLYSVKAWRAGNFSTDIVGTPPMRITKEQGRRLGDLIRGLQSRIRGKLKEIVPEGGRVAHI